MDFLDGIPFLSDYKDYVIPVILVIAAYYILKALYGTAVRMGVTEKVSARLIKTFWPPEREAARLEGKGDLEQAAMLYRRIDRISDAVRCYQNMRDPVTAGQFLESMEKFQEAERMYQRAGSGHHLRSVWTRQGKWDKVAESFMAEDKTGMAAEAFEKAGLPERAAEIYLSAENFDEAGALFRAAGQNGKAAEALEQAYIRDKMFMKDKPETAAVSAELFAAAERPADAARMYVRADMPSEAAQAFERAGDLQGAGEHYYQAKQYEKAAESFRAGGDQERAAVVMAELLENQGRLAEAGELYREGNNPMKAAELFEAEGKNSEAAECYRTTGEYAAAGECHLRAGELSDAAGMFRQAGRYERASGLFLECGEFDKAIDMFEKCGKYYDAGMLLSQLGRTAPAIQTLKRVPSGDERFREASYLLGNMLKKNGLFYEAAEAYGNALLGDVVGIGNMDVFYSLATALEETGRKDEAEDIFRRIMALKPDYRDVRKRLDAET